MLSTDILTPVRAVPRDIDPPDQTPPKWLIILVWLLAAVAFCHAIFVLTAWLTIPLLDQHAFRQTQTALTTYWLMQGGPFFAYETPVLGSPWSIPFELPLYQGVVALLALTGVDLDAAGRLISFAFLLAALWPLWMLWNDLRLPPIGLPIACALLLASPEYLFWSRTFLIESCAWFLALLWLAFFVRFLTNGHPLAAIVALLVGLLAVLTKATTFPGFMVLGGLMLLPSAWRWLRAGLPVSDLPAFALAGAAMLLPLAGDLIWVHYSDALKSANPMGRLLTSGALAGWNYGTLDQRISLGLWQTALMKRVLPDLFGPAWSLAILMIGAALLRQRYTRAILALVAAFVAPFLAFTNLHIIHNYYQYANAAFLIVALAVALGTIASFRRGSVVAAGALLIILFSQAHSFERRQMVSLTADLSHDPIYRIALMARDLIPADGSMIVLGDNWASTVPYYARRKVMALPFWMPLDVLRDALQDPQSHLAGTRFSGVVDCAVGGSEYGPDKQPLVDAFLSGRTVIARFGDCRLLTAER